MKNVISLNVIPEKIPPLCSGEQSRHEKVDQLLLLSGPEKCE